MTRFARRCTRCSTDVEVEPADRAKAYRYGGDYITTNAYDEETLKMVSKIAMRVLGFAEKVRSGVKEERSDDSSVFNAVSAANISSLLARRCRFLVAVQHSEGGAH